MDVPTGTITFALVDVSAGGEARSGAAATMVGLERGRWTNR